MSKYLYLNTEITAKRLGYSTRYFRNTIVKNSLIENVHYIRGFGGRKLIFIWERVEEELLSEVISNKFTIPLASGGVVNG